MATWSPDDVNLARAAAQIREAMRCIHEAEVREAHHRDAR